ncbi:hypothetical protein BOTCAL_0076g00190 [Botryotinia calthae]|uniref:Uncharacterized protein n=1 Tax=Botryotinia calthae TaxID=38488 RepID=A0A4Y8DAW5_9HELO|nr:hypothetical protein BOTCAL_0076g00190 [Botryotinia calthae]
MALHLDHQRVRIEHLLILAQNRKYTAQAHSRERVKLQMYPAYCPRAGGSEETTGLPPRIGNLDTKTLYFTPILYILLYNITNLNQSAIDNAIRQTRSPFPTLGGRSTENDKIDAFGYPVNSENARSPDGKKPLRSEQNPRGGPLPVGRFVLRGGSVWRGGAVRRGEPARGGAYNSGFFNPGGSSQFRGH